MVNELFAIRPIAGMIVNTAFGPGMGMTRRFWTALGAVSLVCAAAPAVVADVRAGVEAWARGDYAKAVEEWRGPAVAGDADAQFNLGQAYKLGRGVPVDLKQAEEWYRRAAVQGHPQAEENYGLALFQNNKRAEAVQWLEKAANRGEPRAQFVLGTMFFNGDAVERDWVRAYALINRSSAQGLPQASQALAQMDRYVSLADRQQGIELARRMEAQQGQPRLASVPPSSAPPRRVARTDIPPSRAVEPQAQPPVATPPEPAPPTRVARAEPPAPRPAPPAATPAPAPARVVDGGWRVQLGAFAEAGNAQRMWSEFGSRFPGRQPYYVRTGRLTKLLVGPFASSAEAQRACAAVRQCIPVRQ